jgi:putative cell wall-binding protein
MKHSVVRIHSEAQTWFATSPYLVTSIKRPASCITGWITFITGARLVKQSEGVVCRECGGQNQPGSQFCWFCGAPLHRRWLGFADRRTTMGWVLFGLRWLVSVAAVLAVFGGLYYAVDRYLLPLFQDEETTGTSVVVTSGSPNRRTTTTVPRTDRVVQAGADRYATAVTISKLGFPEGAAALVLVAGDDYREAISAAPLAAAYGGPTLLVPPDGLRSDLSDEIRRLKPAQIFLLGVARPRTVTRQLEDLLEDSQVTDLTGDNAYETAEQVAAQVKAKLGSISRVVIVPSDGFVEALALAPLAAAEGWPILLASENDDLPRATERALANLAVDSALVVGTTAQVDLGNVETLAGADSFETAASVVRYAVNQGMSFAHTTIATGDAFPDALVAAPYLALDKGILLLAKGGSLPSALLSIYNDNRGAVRTLDIIGLPDLAEDLANPSTSADASGTPSTAGNTGTASTGTTVGSDDSGGD